jgi:hypothetical protein
MCCVHAASDHDRQMGSRTSLPHLGVLPLAVVALAGCGGNASHALATTSDAVSPAGDKVVPRSQPQGVGGYGSGY